MTTNPNEIRQCEVYASIHRQECGQPIYLPPSLYDHLKAHGCDMKDMARVEPIPGVRHGR